MNFVYNKTSLLNTGIICHKNQVFLNRLKRPQYAPPQPTTGTNKIIGADNSPNKYYHYFCKKEIIMHDHIQKLIAEGEHQMLDFKFEVSDCKKIARSLAAFANTDGGRLLIGVKDNGAISGIRTEEEKHMIQTAAKMYCKPEVKFKANEWIINGKKVLEIIIPKSSHFKHKAPDHNNIYKVYIRVKDKNIVANRMLLDIWRHENDKKEIRLSLNNEEMLLLRIINENSKISLEQLIELSGLKKKITEKIVTNFINMRLICFEIDEKNIYFTSE